MKNIPLVPSLECWDGILCEFEQPQPPDLLRSLVAGANRFHAESVQRHPLAWAKGMVAGENMWAWLYEVCQRNAMGTSSAPSNPQRYAEGEAIVDQLMAASHQVITNDQGDRYTVADWRGCVRVASIDLARGFGSMSTGEG